MKKTPINQTSKGALSAKTAKKHLAGRKRKQAANALEKAKDEWIRDFSEMEEDSDDSDEDEQEDPDESDGGECDN